MSGRDYRVDRLIPKATVEPLTSISVRDRIAILNSAEFFLICAIIVIVRRGIIALDMG